jgi:hypothetical protein
MEDGGGIADAVDERVEELRCVHLDAEFELLPEEARLPLAEPPGVEWKSY